MNAKLSKRRKAVLAAAGLLVLLCLCILVSLLVGETRLPLPTTVVYRFFTSALSNPQIQFQGAGSHGFAPHVLATLGRYLAGVLSGTALSLVCLFLIARFQTFQDLFNPVIDILRAIPPLALAPFFLLWFGTSQGGIIAIIVFYAFTMIFVAGAEALERIDPVRADFARTLGAGETTIAARVVLPGLLPAMAGPIKVAYSWSWGLVIVGELLGAHSGVGRILNAFIAILSTDLVVVGIVWVLILALVMEKIVDLVLKALLRWNTDGPNGAALYAGGIRLRRPALDVPVVDVTGGGDAFMAAFLCHYLHHRDALPLPALLEGAIDFCIRASSVAIQHYGAIDSLPTLAEIQALGERADPTA